MFTEPPREPAESSERPDVRDTDAEAERSSDASDGPQAEIESLQDQLLRLRADTDNYRKRLERTTEELVRDAQRAIFLPVLDVVDDLERALRAADGEPADSPLVTGVKLTLDRLRDVLAGHGVRPINANATFDPRYHEVVATVPSADLAAGTIVDELRVGYWWGEDVLRAAHVRVAVEPE
jgi:molecular chaperone GrpE